MTDFISYEHKWGHIYHVQIIILFPLPYPFPSLKTSNLTLGVTGSLDHSGVEGIHTGTICLRQYVCRFMFWALLPACSRGHCWPIPVLSSCISAWGLSLLLSWKPLLRPALIPPAQAKTDHRTESYLSESSCTHRGKGGRNHMHEFVLHHVSVHKCNEGPAFQCCTMQLLQWHTSCNFRVSSLTRKQPSASLLWGRTFPHLGVNC